MFLLSSTELKTTYVTHLLPILRQTEGDWAKLTWQTLCLSRILTLELPNPTSYGRGRTQYIKVLCSLEL